MSAFRMNGCWQSGMIFQRGKPLCFRGLDTPGTRVQVQLLDTDNVTVKEQAESVADANGCWTVRLPAREACARPMTVAVQGSAGRKLLTDILVGDVYLAAGQSNMSFKTKNAIGGKALMADNTRRNLRIMSMPEVPADNGTSIVTPQFDYPGIRWDNGTNSYAIGEFSAVGYTFGRRLYDELGGVPVGVVDISMGGVPIEVYLDRDIIENDEALLERMKATGKYIAVEDALETDNGQLAAFHNAKSVTLAGFAFKGVIWYQGESNHRDPESYTVWLETLQRQWENAFGGGDHLPMFCAHIAPHNSMPQEGNDLYPPLWTKWPQLNEAMDAAARHRPGRIVPLPIYDIHTEADTSLYTDPAVAEHLQAAENTVCHPIHPLDKQPVGERMAGAALTLLYHREAEGRSPTVMDIHFGGGAALVTFERCGAGLKVCRGSAVRGFEVCGGDGVWLPARAELITGDTLRVSSPFVERPQGVAYAFWCMNRGANLVNSENVPVTPFRHGGSEAFFGYRPWMTCDEERVWIDTGWYHEAVPAADKTWHPTPEAALPVPDVGSHFLPAWQVKAGTVSRDGDVKQAGDASLKVNYLAGGAAFGPVLTHMHLNNDVTPFSRLIFALRNGDNRAKKVTLTAESRLGEKAVLPVANGLLPAADGSFHDFEADLTGLSPVFARNLCALTVELSDGAAGCVWVDDVRLAPGGQK